MAKKAIAASWLVVLVIWSTCIISNHNQIALASPPDKENEQDFTIIDYIKDAQKGALPPNGKEDLPKAKYAPGEVIVKFKPDVVNLPAGEEKVLAYKADVKQSSITKLNQKFRLKEIKKVFKHPVKEKKGRFQKTADLMSTQELVKTIKRKFPKRAARAPKLSEIPDLSNIYKLTFEKETDVMAVCAQYQKDPNVEYAIPNYLNKLLMVPYDPYYHSRGSWGQDYDDLWGLKPDKLNCQAAWDISQGEGVIVAVLDTGIDYNHEDIAENIWINPGEDINYNGIVDAGDFNGIDDDANGYIDDIRGYDISDKDRDPFDFNGHGTHTSGTIAAVGNNNIGIIGVAPKAKIMAVKIFPNAYSDVCAQAIKYAADNGADVLSNSWGPILYNPSNPIIEEAVRYAYDLGSVIVFSAGNSNGDVASYSPANMFETITVAASDHNDKKSDFSNWGGKIDVAAPGGDSADFTDPYRKYQNILSLRARNIDPYKDGINIIDTYYYRASGTSMACPHVSGLAALILSHNPNFTNEEVRQIICDSADDVEHPGWDIESGSGRINAHKAFQIKSYPSIAHISSLSFNRENQVFTVKGSAYGARLDSYKIEYGFGFNPTHWETLTISNTPVEAGILSESTVNFNKEGYYSIKLSAIDLNGGEYEDRDFIYNSLYFVLKWGKFGSGDKEFIWPTYIAMDENGYVYVSDFFNSRIQKFDTEGKFIGKWRIVSARGWPLPTGITVDKGGYIWVVDSGGLAVRQYRPDGTLESEFPAGTRYQDAPFGIAVDNDGYIYVSLVGLLGDQDEIRKFDREGNLITVWGSRGKGEGEFDAPLGLAVRENYLYVVDHRNHRIKKFNTEGEYLTQWGKEGRADGEFYLPTGIDIDKNGNVYVLDNFGIQVFDDKGMFLGRWSSQGVDEGQISGTSIVFNGIVTKDDYLYQVDGLKYCVQKFINPFATTVHAKPRSYHKYNNATEGKGSCKTYLTGEGSAGNIVSYEWDFGDGAVGYGETVEHEYVDWKWRGGSNGYYEPYIATLTVTDDKGNTYTDTIEVIVYMPGDVNGDGIVNNLDFSLISANWGKRCSAPDYWGEDSGADSADLNNDREINVLDLIMAGQNNGKTAY